MSITSQADVLTTSVTSGSSVLHAGTTNLDSTVPYAYMTADVSSVSALNGTGNTMGSVSLTRTSTFRLYAREDYVGELSGGAGLPIILYHHHKYSGTATASVGTMGPAHPSRSATGRVDYPTGSTPTGVVTYAYDPTVPTDADTAYHSDSFSTNWIYDYTDANGLDVYYTDTPNISSPKATAQTGLGLVGLGSANASATGTVTDAFYFTTSSVSSY